MKLRRIILPAALILIPIGAAAQDSRPTIFSPLEVWTTGVKLDFKARVGSYLEVSYPSRLNNALNGACMNPASNPILDPTTNPDKLCDAGEFLLCLQVNSNEIHGEQLEVAEVSIQSNEDGETEYVAKGLCHCFCESLKAPTASGF